MEIYNEQILDLLDPTPIGKGKRKAVFKMGDNKDKNSVSWRSGMTSKNKGNLLLLKRSYLFVFVPLQFVVFWEGTGKIKLFF